MGVNESSAPLPSSTGGTPPGVPRRRRAAFAALLAIVSLAAMVRPLEPADERAPVDGAAQRERARRWLAGSLESGGDAPQAARDVATLAFALAALHDAPQSGRWSERLLAAQRPDGSFAGDAAATAYAVFGIESAAAVDPAPAAAAAVARARAWLRSSAANPPSALAADGAAAREPSRRALDFLRASGSTRPAAAEPARDEDEALRWLAGAPLDVRAAYRYLRGDPDRLGTGLAAALRLPAAGTAVHEVLLAARVLARYRSPRLVDDAGRAVAWPARVASALATRWDEAAGAWRDLPAGPPDALATACALLALDAIAPWSLHRSEAGFEEGPEEARDYAILRTDCEQCHQELQPRLHEQWQKSAHAQAGVGCAECHGDNHSRMFREKGRVSPDVCGKCHAREAAEFASSRHARAEETLVSSAMFAATPPEARAACFSCHAIGARALDGGASGSCNHCHTGHLFSAAQSRDPAACVLCHTGADYPQDQAWRLSKHGSLWESTRDPAAAPTCAACHQPGGRHDDGFGLTLGSAGAGGVRAGGEPPVAMREVAAADFAAQRAAMVQVCTECHSSRMAEESLAQADALKEAGDAVLREAVALLRELAAQGRLIGPADALSGPLAGFEPGFEHHLHEPALRADPFLARFYRMWRFTYASCWKGAYHNSPSVANHGSLAGLHEELAGMRADAAMLRRREEVRR